MVVIEMGSDAIQRSSFKAANTCNLCLENPANASGIIDTVEIYAHSNMSSIKVGTFYGSGTRWTCRSATSLGPAPSGQKTTYTNLNIQVEEGDLIGIYFHYGLLYSDDTGGQGVLKKTDTFYVGQTYTFSLLEGDSISLHATGATIPPAFMKPIKIW